MTDVAVRGMGTGLIAAGVNTWVVDAVSEMTTQEIAVRRLRTAELSHGVAVLRARI